MQTHFSIRLAVVTVLVMAGAHVGVAAQGDPKKDLERFQGKWIATGVNGEAMPAGAPELALVVAGDKYQQSSQETLQRRRESASRYRDSHRRHVDRGPDHRGQHKAAGEYGSGRALHRLQKGEVGRIPGMSRLSMTVALCVVVYLAGPILGQAQLSGATALDTLDRDIRAGAYAHVNRLVVMRGTETLATHRWAGRQWWLTKRGGHDVWAGRGSGWCGECLECLSV